MGYFEKGAGLMSPFYSIASFVGARPNISLGSVKKIVRPGIESEAAKKSRTDFINAAMAMH